MRFLALAVCCMWFAASAAAGAATNRAADAVFAQGLKHRNGMGMPASAQAAFGLMSDAAQRGHPPAMFILSNMLAHGEGATPDLEAAQRWLRAAAERDYPEALQQLALQEPDPVKAAQLMRSAGHALKHRSHGH